MPDDRQQKIERLETHTRRQRHARGFWRCRSVNVIVVAISGVPLRRATAFHAIPLLKSLLKSACHRFVAEWKQCISTYHHCVSKISMKGGDLQWCSKL